MKIKFKAIRFLPNRSQLSFFAKWLTKEVTAGLVVAAAIALATLWINNYQARQKEKLQLEKLHLGLSSQYIDSILGIPLVQFYDAHYDADISIYKQSNSVVWCAYDEEKTVAYVVIVKSIGSIRTYVTPNAFGMIKAGYEDIFSLVPLGEDLRTYKKILFISTYLMKPYLLKSKK